MLACFSVSFAWGEDSTKQVFDCTKETCGTSKSESKFFETSIYFHNVNVNTFANNGAMTFKNPVYFSANDKDFEIDTMATFSNNGVMNFESNSVFQLLINVNDGILNFNADMGGDTFYTAVSGNILNSATINVNGQIKFSAAKADETSEYGITRIVNVSGGTFNVNGKTKIEQVVYNTGDFCIYNDTEFKEVFHNYSSGSFMIRRPTIVTYWLNNQDGATLHIKGTTLTINTINDDGVFLAGQGTFWNFQGGILIFSALNGQMGQLVGNFTNKDSTGQNEGKIQVDVTSLTAGQKYQIINGTQILLEEKDVSFLYGTGQYLGNGWVLIDRVFFNQNQTNLKNAIESKSANKNSSWISRAVLDTETMLKTSIITQPTNMLKAFKADTLNAPLNSAYVTRLTASSASIMSDASSFANPLEKASQTQFFATPFGGVLKGDDLSGHLLGLSVGLTHIDDDYIAQGHFAYANGTSKQDLQTQSTQINGNLFQVGGFGRLFYDKLETDINANFIFAKFSLDNTWLDNGLNSSSNFNNYQINLGAVAGWRFGDDLSVKPFAGLQTYYENQGEFKQDMLNLTSEAYSALVMDAVVGVEGRYIFENGGFAFAKASYENKLYNSHKEVFMRVGTEALHYENESYDNVASLNLGARVLATKALKLDIEGLYKHYDNGVDYLGANLSVRWSF